MVVAAAFGITLALLAGSLSASSIGAQQAPGEAAGTQATVVLLAGVVARGGGVVVDAESRTGAGGPAMRFPSFDPSAGGPRAAVVARNSKGTEVLNPGAQDFSFGATVRLDSASEKAGTSDDGNNVLQRGLFAARSQYKIQLDARRPSCRVKGSQGAVMVSARSTVTPGRWYGLACVRTGDTVELTVTRWTTEGTPRTEVNTATGATGELRAAASLPLSVGAKVEDNGRLTTSPDQFNGVIDDPFVRIGASVVGVALPGGAPPDPPTSPDPPTPPAPAPARIATTTHVAVNKPAARKGTTVRVKGSVAPVGATHGSEVRLRIVKHRKDGTKRLVRRETEWLSSTGTFRFRDIPVRARTTYKVVFPRQGILLASKDKLAYRKGRFHSR